MAANEKWHRLPTPPDSLHVEWAILGKYLVSGIGAGSGDSIVARMDGKTPAWLSALKQKLAVERVSTVFYLNVKKGLELAAPLIGSPEMRQVLEALGVANIRTIASVSGLDGTGCLSKTWIETISDPSGLLAVFGPEPLKAADLAMIPKDASFAAAARLNLSKLYGAVIEAIKRVGPEAASSNEAQLAQTETMLGFRIKQDLLDALGDSWCVYNSPSEGGLLITGLTIIVPVKDRDRLAKTNDRLVELAGNAAPGTPAIKETKFHGQRIFFVDPVGNELLPAPAWSVTDTHLILSLSPQNVRAVLSRDASAGSIADLPVVAERLKSGDAVLLTYQDTAGTMKIIYPVLQILPRSVSPNCNAKESISTPRRFRRWPRLFATSSRESEHSCREKRPRLREPPISAGERELASAVRGRNVFRLCDAAGAGCSGSASLTRLREVRNQVGPRKNLRKCRCCRETRRRHCGSRSRLPDGTWISQNFVGYIARGRTDRRVEVPPGRRNLLRRPAGISCYKIRVVFSFRKAL